MFKQFDFTAPQATSNLTKMARDITCTLKSLLFINCVYLATQKNWISFFLNAGCLFFSKTIFNQLSLNHFQFVDIKGMLSCYKVLYSQGGNIIFNMFDFNK